MQELLQIGAPVLALVFSVTLVAGFIKGAVGFGLPMIMVAGLATFLPPDLVLAVVILPALTSNLWLATQRGWRDTIEAAISFRFFIVIMLIFLLISAQMVRSIPPRAVLLVIGVPIAFFATIQLFGVRFSLARKARLPVEAAVAAMSGFVGGMSGIWGPPLVTYLTAVNTPKHTQMRLQGVVYTIASIALLGAHFRSGILDRSTLALSVYALIPAMIGVWLGTAWHDRLPQQMFRRLTLVILVLAGGNLIRRAMLG